MTKGVEYSVVQQGCLLDFFWGVHSPTPDGT